MNKKKLSLIIDFSLIFLNYLQRKIHNICEHSRQMLQVEVVLGAVRYSYLCFEF